MDGRERADLGFGSELDDFDPENWQPQPRPAPQSDPNLRKLAEASGFRSREAAVPVSAGQGAPVAGPAAVPSRAEVAEAPAPLRRRRTGRNQQFNLKARPETIEAYCRIADAQGWGLGETLEQAVALLEERFGRG
ncbi:stability/partitioning determinant [Salipiger mangrovisoli]|uniref:Stability/partitioning determinant n=1 Tax=Salipiger mangrovisoli TaxID=2865933 RepID=A0ABR9XA23_9RHOB|nr:stability/partitioning determinant [Salipiger mangrovisoli]MBE9640438.1 stability/partitioning determinant [Salipiger mangrovisoli]